MQSQFLAEMTPVDSYDEIDEILRSRSFEQGVHTESERFSAGTLITLSDATHITRRRAENALFHPDALRRYESAQLRPVVDETLAALRSGRSGSSGSVRVDLVPLMNTLLHRVAASTIGIDGVDTPSSIARFIEFAHSFSAGHQVEWWTDDHRAVLEHALEQRDLFATEFFNPSRDRRVKLLEQAGKTAQSADLPVDLITILLGHVEVDNDQLLREVCFYLVAATQTTSHAVPHLLAHLWDWFAEHPEDVSRRLDEDFLRRAAQESLRLHTPHPAFVRRAARDVTLRSGRQITAGETVALLYGHANRDPARFGTEPERFDPYREVRSGTPPWGFTFGAGAHACIGRPLAMGSDAANSTSITGMLSVIVRSLLIAGARRDTTQQSMLNSESHHDAYERFPILLDAAVQPSEG